MRQKWFFSNGEYPYNTEYLKERLEKEYPGFFLARINIERYVKLEKQIEQQLGTNHKKLIELNLFTRIDIDSCDSPSLEALKLKAQYPDGLKIGRIKQQECLFRENWLDCFIIYKPIEKPIKEKVRNKMLNLFV